MLLSNPVISEPISRNLGWKKNFYFCLISLYIVFLPPFHPWNFTIFSCVLPSPVLTFLPLSPLLYASLVWPACYFQIFLDLFDFSIFHVKVKPSNSYQFPSDGTEHFLLPMIPIWRVSDQQKIIAFDMSFIYLDCIVLIFSLIFWPNCIAFHSTLSLILWKLRLVREELMLFQYRSEDSSEFPSILKILCGTTRAKQIFFAYWASLCTLQEC